MTGYEDPNAVSGYGTATGEARFVMRHCSYICVHIMHAVECQSFVIWLLQLLVYVCSISSARY